MKKTHNRHVDDDKAITRGFKKMEMVHGSAYGDVTWREWCKREKARIEEKGDKMVRIASDGERIWLSRGKAR